MRSSSSAEGTAGHATGRVADRGAGPGEGEAPLLRPLCLDADAEAATDVEVAGAKAAALARARGLGLPALPGFVLPVAAARAALRAALEALERGGSGAARRAAFGVRIDVALLAELRRVVDRLGGRVIVRSSSPLEGDQRWSGAFSSLNEVGPDGIGVAVRSCWASAFAVDPLERLEHCEAGPGALGLAVLIQPEIVPVAGGIARLDGTADARSDQGVVHVTGVRGHPGGLLAGWAEGATARVGAPAGPRPEPGAGGRLAALVGEETVARAAGLMRAAHRALGHDTIEWAAAGGEVHLLQSSRSSGPVGAGTPRSSGAGADLSHGTRVAGTVCVAGDAVGRLRYVRPHRRSPAGDGDGDGHILVCDRPLPALAPLLFGARGLVARGGPADSHLAEVARSIGVPMLILRGDLDGVTGPLDLLEDGGDWLGVIDGARGELVVGRRLLSDP